jgi:hypothetical protein
VLADSVDTRTAIVGDGHDTFQEDTLTVMRTKNCTVGNERPRLDFLALRKAIPSAKSGMQLFQRGLFILAIEVERSPELHET